MRKLKCFGESSLDGASSALGRYLTWAAARKPPGSTLSGSAASEFLESLGASARDSVLASFAWLSDWCGLVLPSRGPACRAHRTGQPQSSNDTLALGLWIIMGLEWLAVHHPSEFVRGHAAGWLYLALHALRAEQSHAHVINAWVLHDTAHITVAAVRRDKHPDPSKRRPRPVWGCFDGLLYPGAARRTLIETLEGAEAVRCVLRDTDSRDGAPSGASRWVLAPLEAGSRPDKSLQSLLQMQPIGLSPEQASHYHPHAAKRFLQCAIEASPSLSLAVHGAESGRFSGSTAQNSDLEPTAQLLRQHELRSTVLPSIYASKAKVQSVFSRTAEIQAVLVAAAQRVHDGRAIPREHGFAESFGSP